MSVILNLIVFILVLTVIVAFHEFGHFIMAKKTGVYDDLMSVFLNDKEKVNKIFI